MGRNKTVIRLEKEEQGIKTTTMEVYEDDLKFLLEQVAKHIRPSAKDSLALLVKAIRKAQEKESKATQKKKVKMFDEGLRRYKKIQDIK